MTAGIVYSDGQILCRVVHKRGVKPHYLPFGIGDGKRVVRGHKAERGVWHIVVCTQLREGRVGHIKTERKGFGHTRGGAECNAPDGIHSRHFVAGVKRLGIGVGKLRAHHITVSAPTAVTSNLAARLGHKVIHRGVGSIVSVV